MKKVLMLCVLSIICGSLSANATNDINSSQIEKIDKLIEKLIIYQLANPSDDEAKNALRKLVETRRELLDSTDNQDAEVAVISDEKNNAEQQIKTSSVSESSSQDKLNFATPRRLFLELFN